MHPGHKGPVLLRLEVPQKKMGLLTHLRVKDRNSVMEMIFSSILSKQCKARINRLRPSLAHYHNFVMKRTASARKSSYTDSEHCCPPESLHSPREGYYK